MSEIEDGVEYRAEQLKDTRSGGTNQQSGLHSALMKIVQIRFTPISIKILQPPILLLLLIFAMFVNSIIHSFTFIVSIIIIIRKISSLLLLLYNEYP